MDTLEIVPEAKRIVFEVFDIEDETKLMMDAGSISVYATLRMHASSPVRVRVDAGDEETLIKVTAQGDSKHKYETRVFTDTLTPELLERYLTRAYADMTYELDMEARRAARGL